MEIINPINKYLYDPIVKFFFALLIVLSVSSCTTGYGLKADSSMGGYEIINYDEASFQVQVLGNALTSKQKIVDIALRASAEETRNRGFSYFVILNRTKSSEGNTIIYSKPFTTDVMGDDYDSLQSSFKETILILSKNELVHVRGAYLEAGKVISETNYLIE